MAGDSYARIGAVEKTGAILKYLAAQKTPVPGNEVAAAVGLPGPTAMCHLMTLLDIGYVRKVGDGWELGMGLALFWAKKRASLESDRERLDKAIALLGGDN